MRFAAGDLQAALEARGHRTRVVDPKDPADFVLGPMHDPGLLEAFEAAGGRPVGAMSAEGYAVRITRGAGGRRTVWAVGADNTGAMYAGLDVAEQIAHGGLQAVEEKDAQPFVEKRGLKINVPLDARTPAYADCGDAAQQNMAMIWDLGFWKAHLDQMARHRYNTVTMWNAHPFPALIHVPDYPDVALQDVKIADIDWLEWFPKYAGRGGSRGVTTEILDNLKTVRAMSMDDKIAHWRAVMQHAHDRGIEFHLITWNVFAWAADGKHGITDDHDNPVLVDYLRQSVRVLFETYPLLAGIGVTAGERMNRLSPDEKERWLWNTYGRGVVEARAKFPGRKIRFIHRYWQTQIPDITKHFEGLGDDVDFDFSFKYVRARLYAHTDPPFADRVLAESPAGTKWWWNLRNDDIFYFRWGDPDYVRAFIGHLPPPEQTRGFHMGSDGYVWGREFVSTQPDSPRQLEIDKHWYRFMLWGRLGYDPKLTNDFFRAELARRFPGKPAGDLQAVWARASKIIPAVNREHWHNWDFQWAVEACRGRKGYHAITDKSWKPGGAAAAREIRSHAEAVLAQLKPLKALPGDKTWTRTLGDIEAMAHLGLYYAQKILAADRKADAPEQAVEHLVAAAAHWKDYATIGARQYKPQLLSKGGYADWDQGYDNALKDIELMRGAAEQTPPE